MDNTSKAKAFIELLNQKKFSQATSYFSDAVKSQLPEQKLAEVWNSLPSQVGKFKGLGKSKSVTKGQYEVIVILGEFEKTNLDLEITFNKKGKIDGFFMRPSTNSKSKSSENYKAPDYANPKLFTEKEVIVGSGEWKLPGTLTVPKEKRKHPAVIVVHGSGPNDRDGTHVNPANKPYKDLALGLASKGVAVLRYKKRTKEHSRKLAAFKKLTVKEEVIDDVFFAVDLLRKDQQIDANKIYVLGHSLGGYLIPRINKRSNQISGFISLAGATKHLEDAYLEQNEYFVNLDGKVSEAEQKGLDEIKSIVKKIKALKKEDLDSSKVYIGAYPAYWLDLQKYNPTHDAKSIIKPFLILQGERDYQVTMEDFSNWKKALKGKDNVKFKSYPKLNHIFMAGEGTPSPSEYSRVGHVSEQVITDIADWTHKVKK